MTRVFFYLLLLVGLLATPLAYAQDDAPACTQTVTVWDNDTISSIANELNIDAAALASLNNLTLATPLLIGQKLCVEGLAAPPADDAAIGGSTDEAPPPTDTVSAEDDSADEMPEAVVNPAPAGTNFQRGQNGVPAGWSLHRVDSGDTLYSITRQYNVRLSEVIAANNIPNVNVVFLGESLLIPPNATMPESNESEEDAESDTPDETPSDDDAPAVGGPVAVHTPAEGSIPVINLNPVRAAPGEVITVSGVNYPGNRTVELFIEKQSLGLRSEVLETVTTEPNGTFSVALTIPDEWTEGDPVEELTVSISGYTATGGYWGMNYFVNTEAIR